MLSPIICKVYVLKLVSFGHPNSRQRAIKGNSIGFMNDVHSVCTQLPNVDSLNSYIKVVFIGDETTPLPVQQIKKVLRVLDVVTNKPSRIY